MQDPPNFAPSRAPPGPVQNAAGDPIVQVIATVLWVILSWETGERASPRPHKLWVNTSVAVSWSIPAGNAEPLLARALRMPPNKIVVLRNWRKSQSQNSQNQDQSWQHPLKPKLLEP